MLEARVQDVNSQINLCTRNQVNTYGSKQGPNAFTLFLNKHFNQMKAKYAHLTVHELHRLIDSKFKTLSPEERLMYENQSKEIQTKQHLMIEKHFAEIDDLKKKIHQIRFPFVATAQNQLNLDEDFRFAGENKANFTLEEAMTGCS